MISKKTLNQDHIDIIEKETNILLQLNHPNIIKLLDFKKTKNNWYLIFEYCEKGDLENYMKKFYEGGKFPEEDAQRMIQQLSSAFQEIQKYHIVHRDLKLANILVSTDFTIKVADFGFARHLDEDNFLLSYCGTPITMAPEILKR